MSKRRPIRSMIADDATDDELKERLKLILAIREFARTELKLPAEGQFRTYVDLGRKHVVWNVYAAPEFSMAPKSWYFPIVGYTVYKGFFSEESARHLSKKLQKHGFDVHVSGASAYSTLGWFSDPVLSTALHCREENLAALLFHELAHQVLYIKNDTAFNEGFAVAVEQEGVRRWLEIRGEHERFENYLQERKQRAEFAGLVKACRVRLSSLYRRKDIDIGEKRAQKALIFEQMREEYEQLKVNWNGDCGYDGWFYSPMNNAKLLPVAVYSDYVPFFTDMIQQADGDMHAFFKNCRRLSRKNPEERVALLSRKPETLSSRL